MVDFLLLLETLPFYLKNNFVYIISNQKHIYSVQKQEYV